MIIALSQKFRNFILNSNLNSEKTKRSYMRILLVFLLLIGFRSEAQPPADICKEVNDIALFEQMAHQRLIGGAGNNIVTNAASGNYDVKYYRCEWEVDPAVRYIKGKVTIYFNIVASTNSIQLDLMNPLVVDSIKQHNILLTKQHSNNVVTVNLLGTLNAGTLDSVSVYYQGVPANTGFGSFVLSAHGAPVVPVMWSLSEPYGSRDWWPCKNGLDDKADSIDIIVTNPSAYSAASNGLLQSENLIAGGTKKVTYWKHRYPIASYLMCFAVTNYTVFNNTVQLGATNLPMQTYCYPEYLDYFKSGTQNVLDALVLFHNTFGDYPFIKEKYGHVQFGWGGGMEHQTSTFVIGVSETLVTHELAHQWFGDKITCASWEDIWLNEGFATFVSAFYMESKYPANATNARKNVLNSITSAPDGSVWVDDTTNVGRIFSGRLSYNKGSYLLNMLRWIMGDEQFFKALRQYQLDPALKYGFAKTDDLKKHLEQVSGKNFTKFFQDWYKGQGYPSYNVQWSQLGANHVKIKMNQTTSHPSVSFYELPVALKFKNATQEKTIVVDNKTNGEIFIRDIGFIADTVYVDPALWLVTKNNTTAKVPDPALAQNKIDIFPNPIQDRFYIYLHSIAATTADIGLYNAVGQLVYSKSVNLINGAEYIEVPTPNLASGMYTVVVRAGKSKFVKKLIR